MSEERIDIVVTGRGATEVKRDLENLGRAALNSIPSIDALKKALGSIGSVSAQLRSALSGLSQYTDRLRTGFNQISAVGNQMSTSLSNSFKNLATQAIPHATTAMNAFRNSTQQAASVLSSGLTAAANKASGAMGYLARNTRGALAVMAGLHKLPPAMNATATAIQNAGGAANNALPPVKGITAEFFTLWRVLLAISLLTGLGVGLGAALDQWTMMSNKLRQVSLDEANLVATQDAVYESAQRTRTGMEDLGTLYTRTSMATEKLGLSQKEVMGITETVAMAMKMSGATVQESATAMRQLSQAFNKGKLDGDEFKSIMETAPGLQKAFAEGLGVTKDKLMAMSEAGQLTLPRLIDALQKAGPAIEKAFGKSLPTISEGFTYLGNAVVKFLGKLDEATGFSRGFYNVLKVLGDNIDVVAVAVTALGVAIIVAFGPAALAALGAFAVALGFATGGLSYIIPLLAAAITAIYAFGDSWKVTADGITVLDYIRAALQIVGEYAGVVAQYISDKWSEAWSWTEGAGERIGSLGENLQELGLLAQTAAEGFVGIWFGALDALVAGFNTLPAALKAIMQNAMNGMIEIVESGVNAILGSLNSILSYARMGTIGTVDLSGYKVKVEQAGKGIGESMGEAFSKGMTRGKEIVGAMVKDVVPLADKALTTWTDKARAIKDERTKLEGGSLSDAKGINTFVAPDGKKKRGGGGSGRGDQTQSALDSLLRTIDPITGAQEKLRQGTETLDKAYAAGLITLDRRNELLDRYTEHMRDQLDPLGKINRDMEEEASLLRLSNDERQIQKTLLDDIEKLRKAGVDLSPVEQEALEKNIRSLESLKEQARSLGDVMSRVFKGAEDSFVEFIETGKVSFSSLTSSILSDIARMAFQSFITKPLEGVLTSALGGIMPMLSSAAGSMFGGAAAGVAAGAAPLTAMPALYATGGSFTVGGSGGVDSQMVRFRASPGERVSVSRPGSESNGGNPAQIVFNIQTPDVKSFKASEAQIAARMSRLAARGNRNL